MLTVGMYVSKIDAKSVLLDAEAKNKLRDVFRGIFNGKRGENFKTYIFLNILFKFQDSIWLVLQQDGRLPAAYFGPSHFVKKAFKKIKTFFSRKKNTLSSPYFLIFPTFKVF